MNKSCEVCGKEFEAVRSDARYCSAVCQKQAKRAGNPVRDKLPQTEPVQVVRDNQDNVRDKVSVTFTRKLSSEINMDKLTGPQAQELLKEACKIDPRINPIQEDWAAISGARIRHKFGLPKPYKPPIIDKAALDKLRERVNQWDGVSAVRGEVA